MTDTTNEIKKQLDELKAQKVKLDVETKKVKTKKTVKVEKVKTKKTVKAQKVKAQKVKAQKVKAQKVKAQKVKAQKIKAQKVKAQKVKAEKVKAEKVKAEKVKAEKVKAEKVKADLKEEPKTPEEELEEQFSDEQIRNFKIEKMDMDKISNKVCEIVASYEDKGILQSDLWKKMKFSGRDGSRLALRLERRGFITREKILQKGRWTYNLIIEKAPISLESLQDAPCLTCPVEQKCYTENVFPAPSPLHCKLIEDWVFEEFSKKKK